MLLAHTPCDFRDDVNQLLIDAGYEVKCAGDSQEALVCLCREMGPRPDVLIIEEGLPGRGGTETLRVAHRLTHQRGLRIILLSDVEVDERILQDLRVGDFLRKPVEPIEVLWAVQRLDRNKH